MRFDRNVYGCCFFSHSASDFSLVLTTPPDNLVRTRVKERVKAVLATSRVALVLEGLQETRL